MNKITQFVVFILTADILHLKKAHHCVIYQFIKFSMKEKLKQNSTKSMTGFQVINNNTLTKTA